MTAEQFFTEHLDYSYSGLEAVENAVNAGDWDGAQKAFGAFVRGWMTPERRLTRPINWDSSPVKPGETYLQAAQRLLRNEIVSCGIPYRYPGEIDWEYNPTPNQYREWTWQISRHHEFRILAQAYRETADEAYTRQYLRMILGWIAQAPVPENEPGGNPRSNCWRTIEAGLRMSGNWYDALHTFCHSPEMADRDITTVVASVWENGWRLRHFSTTGNWLFMEMTGLAYVGLLFPYFRESAEWYGYAVETLEKQLEYQLYPDGFQFELTTNYHHVVLENCLWALDACRIVQQPYPERLLHGIRRMYDLYPKLIMPDGRLPCLNDGNYLPMSVAMENAVKLFPEDPAYRFLHTAGDEGAPPPFTSVQLPYSGLAVMRTGWGREAVWCMLEAAPFGRGHQHEDKLEVLMQAYGTDFLVEAGTNAYDDSTRHRYALCSKGHNTVLVDNCSQNRRARYRWTEACMKETAGMFWRSEEAFDAAQGLYDEGYGPAFLPVRHTRRLLLLKEWNGLPPFAVVIDRLDNTDGISHSYQSLWHFCDMPVMLDGLSARALSAAGPSLTVMTAGQDSLSIVRGEWEPEFQGWLASTDVDARLPAPTLIARRMADRPVRLVTLLFPSHTPDCPVVRCEAGDCAEETKVYLATKNQVYQLDENDYFI